MAESAILQITNLTKRFGRTTAVKSVDIKVGKGEVYALIGPNGSGKTTLINMIVGLLHPDSGDVLIGGTSIEQRPVVAKTLFGYVPDNPTNYPFLSGIEFIRMTARLRSMEESQANKKISELIRIFPIHDILQNRIETYSRGNMQKVAFLSALVGEPKLLIIDEPIVGLDPISIKIFGDTLKSYAKEGNSVFLSTHTLPFAEKYATKIGILNKGVLVHETSSTSNLDRIYEKYTE